MKKSTVYIDESGDLGCGRGTRWFVITAVIVDKEKERSIRQTMDLIKTRLNVKDIHLRKIADFYRRAYITRELNNEDFVYVNIIVDTNKIDRSKLSSPEVTYNYLCRLLIERVSWYLRDTERTADIVLSARGTSRDGELIEYIKEKLIPYEDNQIVSGVFENVIAKTANSWDLLQLADVCATTTFLAFEVKRLGFSTPCFLKILKKHLYRYGDKVQSYGIKFFTEEMKPDLDEIISNYPCKEKERTSGATSTE